MAFYSKREITSRLPGLAHPTTPQLSESERLVKQTYSVHVFLPVDRPRSIVRKWHLSKKLSFTTKLGSIVTIPSGLF
jgi:hypothetical protein